MSGLDTGPRRGSTRPTAKQGQHGATALGGKAVTGPGSAALKYDILTALLVTSACGDPVEGRLALRLSLLITARFNWRSGTFAVGQREMARMWGVTERTAKREIAHLRTKGWIVISVSAARGRVAQYRIEIEQLLRDTMPYWEAVGPDFVARMTNSPAPDVSSNVVPLHADTPLPPQDGSVWPKAAATLQAQDGAVYSAWLSGLVVADVDGGALILLAPSAFIAGYIETHYKTRLLAAVLPLDPGLRDVRVVAAD